MSNSALGREYLVASGCFRESEFHWPLSGDEFEEQTDATRPKAVLGTLPEQTFKGGSIALLRE